MFVLTQSHEATKVENRVSAATGAVVSPFFVLFSFLSADVLWVADEGRDEEMGSRTAPCDAIPDAHDLARTIPW
jgi:hypothetical protein